MSSFPLAYDPAEELPCVNALQRAWGIDFDPAIHRDDSMFRHAVDRRQGSRELALFEYLRSGHEAARLSVALLRLRFGQGLAGRKILELGCGFGRVTRFLIPWLDRAELYSAELEPGALEFQAARFGADRHLASRRPEDLAPTLEFDAIVAHSLLSHFPRASFDRWVEVLVSRLAPGGLLIFSVHSPGDKPLSVASDVDGFAFIPISESTVLPGGDYGVSWVEPDYVARSLPTTVEHRTWVRGLWDLQDLHVVARPPGRPLPDLSELLAAPVGILDACRLQSTESLRLEGWAIGSAPHLGCPEVSFRVDGETRWSGPPTTPRADVAERRSLPIDLPVGFRIELKDSVPAPRSRSLLELTVADERGSTIVHCGPIEATTVWLRAAALDDSLRRCKIELASWERSRWAILRRWARRLRGQPARTVLDLDA